MANEGHVEHNEGHVEHNEGHVEHNEDVEGHTLAEKNSDGRASEGHETSDDDDVEGHVLPANEG